MPASSSSSSPVPVASTSSATRVVSPLPSATAGAASPKGFSGSLVLSSASMARAPQPTDGALPNNTGIHHKTTNTDLRFKVSRQETAGSSLKS
eukprot:scaffold7395_cov229-Pinguiococcus_pyrenoidosus.AAC.2